MANQWFRLYSEFSTDPKVQSMSEAMQRRLLMLFCIHNSNVLATLHNDEIATALRIDAAELEETKQLFIKKGFLDDAWKLLNWEKRQFKSDSSTDRSRKHREEKKIMQQQCNVAATSPEADTETETEYKHDPNGSCSFSTLEKKRDGQLEGSEEGAKKRQQANVPYQKIVDLYHEILPMCPENLILNDERRGNIRARWKEGYDDIELWRQFFYRVAESDFLTGKSEAREGKKPFVATLEWLIRPRNWAKVVEHKYRG